MAELEGIKKRISRQIEGEKHELETLPDHWFRPRKYSMQGAEEIDNCQAELRKQLKNPAIMKYVKRVQDLEKENPTIKDVMETLTEEELLDFLNVLGESGKRKTSQLYSMMLLYGIGEHNFKDDEGKPCVVDRALVEVLSQSQEIVNEMVAVIQEHNPPLASGTSGKSETS